MTDKELLALYGIAITGDNLRYADYCVATWCGQPLLVQRIASVNADYVKYYLRMPSALVHSDFGYIMLELNGDVRRCILYAGNYAAMD